MWNVTKAVKERFEKCNLLPIPETDEEWEYMKEVAEEEGEDLEARLQEELAEVKEELLAVLPSRFHSYIENETLNRPTLPKEVREDYLQWIRDEEIEFEQILDAAHENKTRALVDLPKAVQEVFSESLHDATIERMERIGNDLHLYVNTDGGFTPHAYIHFTFTDVISEETDEALQVGQWFIYDELQKTEEAFAFRVLFECPTAEWTITMKGIDATYYYRPALYTILRDEEKLTETTVEEYMNQLNPEYNYWLITPDIIYPVKALADVAIEMREQDFVVGLDGNKYTYSLEEHHPNQFIYTDVYEDPYASFEEPVPMEEIEAAALGDDLELQVRAWNTMYANPEELKDIINRVLDKMTVTEENEMMISVFTSHFYEAGIMSESNVKKYQEFIE